MITIAAKSEGTKDDRIEKAFFIVEPNQPQLSEVARLLETTELQFRVDAIVPLAQASEAYLGAIQNRAGRGKVVISIVDQ